jgi:hypothetical protein
VPDVHDSAHVARERVVVVVVVWRGVLLVVS